MPVSQYLAPQYGLLRTPSPQVARETCDAVALNVATHREATSFKRISARLPPLSIGCASRAAWQLMEAYYKLSAIGQNTLLSPTKVVFCQPK